MSDKLVPRLGCLALLAIAALCGCEAATDGAASGAVVDNATTAHPPLDGERNEPVDLAANDRGGAESLSSGPWRLAAIKRSAASADEPVAPEPAYTIEFGADGRFAGRADCNRFAGSFQLAGDSQNAPGLLTVSDAAATLAACPQPSIADEFLRAIGAITRYDLHGDRLRLSFGADGVLTFARDSVTAAAAPEIGRTFVFECDGDVHFTVRTGPGEVALWAPKSIGGQYLVLSSTPAASGARYQEGDTVYWNRGDTALFEIGGRRFVDCQSDPREVPWADAARRGVTFRALGNEPAWSAEVARDQFTVITNLGTERTELPYAAPSVAGTTTTYRTRTDVHRLVLVVQRVGCTDSMSGEAFEATATVTLDDTIFHGCGRFL